eukprot:6764339-Karenia_brevis.AAC.1
MAPAGSIQHLCLSYWLKSRWCYSLSWRGKLATGVGGGLKPWGEAKGRTLWSTSWAGSGGMAL